MNTKIKIIRLYFKILSALSPKFAAQKALDLFASPRLKKVRDREREFFEKSEIIRLKNEPEDIIIYQLGNKDDKPILMVHGWDSNPGSMSGIAFKLVEKGFRVLVLNVPAHGISKEKYTNMIDVSELIRKIMQEMKFPDKISIISHSFGSGAVSFALEKCKIGVDKLAFVTTSENIIDIFDEFKDFIGISDKVYRLMNKIIEDRYNLKLESLVVSDALKNSKFNQLLLVHDEEDKILPFANSASINRQIPNSTLIPTKGKGHYRILWDKDVIDNVVKFIS